MQNVVVSGLGPGMGCAISRALTAAGYRVYTISRSTAGDKIAAGIGVRHYSGDLRDPRSVHEVFSSIVHDAGRIDHVIHTAGGFFRNAAVKDVDPDLFSSALMNNAQTFYNVVRESTGHLAESRGSITALTAARHVYMNSHAGYAAGKGAVTFMVQELAGELAPMGIRVNAVAPGFISKENCGESDVRNLLGKGRHSAGAIASAVMWIMKNEEITGQTIEVDSGFGTQIDDGL
ncbi:MAG: SDR family oxidoreductase [Thermoplasmataceae archaeon]